MKKIGLLIGITFIFVFGLKSTNYNFQFDSIPEVPLRIDVNESIHLGDIELANVLSPSVFFGEIESSALQQSSEEFLWVKINLKNNSNLIINGFLQTCATADSVTVYQLINGTINFLMQTGNTISPYNKYIHAIDGYIPIVIPLNEEATFFIRYHFPKQVNKNLVRFLVYTPQKYLYNTNITSYASQYFYLGCMLFISFIGILMYLIFKETTLLYFSSFMFFLGLYFPKLNGSLDSFFLFYLKNDYVRIVEVIISGVIISAFLFFAKFTELKKSTPKFYKFYFLVTFIGEGLTHLMNLVGLRNEFVLYHNIIILIWIVMTFTTIVIYAKNGERFGKSLLYSVFILFGGAMLYVLSLISVLPRSSFLTNSFQIGSLLFSGMLFYILFNKVKTIKEEQKQGEEINQIKSNFFANISHELRTPLTLMLGPIQQLLEKTEDIKDKRLLILASKNASRQLELVNQLLDLSKLESGKLELEVQEQNIVSFSKSLYFNYESLANKRNIKLCFEADKNDLALYFDADKMEKILTNLVTNALNFSNENGEIQLKISSDRNFVILSIKDFGKGISKENISKIFDRFFSISNEEGFTQGTGIGLSLVKELVKLHKGTIKVESVIGSGTEFKLQFKLGKKHFNSELISENKTFGNSNRSSLLEDFEDAIENEKLDDKEKNKLPIVLLIEDNADVREFIIQRIEEEYQVIQAVNGEEGINLAIEHQPDLVISDVMMPIKDGFEVCKTLKSNIQTSHIPIILLTAKADQEEIITGYQQGADAYILKPFNTQEILIRIKNLIDSRLELKKTFSTSFFIKPEEITTNSIDSEFIEKATSFIEFNISNEKLNVDYISEELGISKANLNRKFRALLNLSTNQFIQSIKLKKGAELLKAEGLSVSEVAFQTGFSSPAYFIKCFKAQFEMTPKEYANQ